MGQIPQRPAPSSSASAGEVHKGLHNDTGLYHCFLNVVIQSLWHLRSFRERFLSLDYTHSCLRKPCAFCALRTIFTMYKFGEGAVIPPETLRSALSEIYKSDLRFQLQQMADASECLDEILKLMHCDHSGIIDVAKYDEIACTPPCISHATFGAQMMDQKVCRACGATSDPVIDNSFIFNIYASSLYSKGRFKSFYDCIRSEWRARSYSCPGNDVDDSSHDRKIHNDNNGAKGDVKVNDDIIRRPEGHICSHNNNINSKQDLNNDKNENSNNDKSDSQQQHRNKRGMLHVRLRLDASSSSSASPPLPPPPPPPPAQRPSLSSCKGRAFIRRWCLGFPDTFALNVTWPSQPSKQQIERMLQALPGKIDLQKLVSFPTHLEATRKGRSLQLKGMILYYGKHYFATFLSQSKHWLLLNDKKVTDLGKWKDLANRAVRGKWQPTVLFYESETVTTRSSYKLARTMMPNMRNQRRSIPPPPTSAPPIIPADANRGKQPIVTTVTDVRVLVGGNASREEGAVMVKVLKEGEGEQQQESRDNTDAKATIISRTAIVAATPIVAAEAKKTSDMINLPGGTPSPPPSACCDDDKGSSVPAF